ncbi:hypothetical protein BpHYR1_041259 [Brachionus plicatilis]|uniref:Uncharacterized protein n=1 Tax=Brachionus plicatilis TaxID=10195 RepID=A0A3M7P346_BRAPC|nr:hypothetical protein BpHYR1_041259 [Brachionus plicatilis]
MAPVQSHGPRQQSVDENLKMINKYYNDTNASFEQLPQWALGHNLNVALVNQLYYNPAAQNFLLFYHNIINFYQPTKFPHSIIAQMLLELRLNPETIDLSISNGV